MKASDVMSVGVITIAPDATVQAAARLMLEKGISALPVVDASETLIGVISEGDLIRRAETGTERKPSWWLTLISGPDRLASDFIKAHGLKVSDVMTRDVITAAPDTQLADIAKLLERNRIKRVPILDGGKLVGIVSRANLMQALASAASMFERTAPVNDANLRDEITKRMWAQPWSNPSLINVIVTNGVVDLWGMVLSQTERNALRVLIEETPGVKGINDHLTIRRVASGM